MPWKVGDVDDHMKDLSADEKKTWVEVANERLKANLKKGMKQSAAEASAIKQANSVVGKLKESAINVWLSESTSYTALVEDIGNKVGKLAPPDGWAYPVEVFDDFVVYQVGAPNMETAYFKAPYSKNADGMVSLGSAVKVKKVTSYPLTERINESSDTELSEKGGMLLANSNNLVENGLIVAET